MTLPQRVRDIADNFNLPDDASPAKLGFEEVYV